MFRHVATYYAFKIEQYTFGECSKCTLEKLNYAHFWPVKWCILDHLL